MKTILAFAIGLLVIVSATTSPALAPVHVWSKSFGSTGADEAGRAVAVDASGNVVVAGYFQGSVDFGGGPLVSAGLIDIFVAKYDASGAHQWSQRFGSTGNDFGYGVAVDGLGNVVMTGVFEGTVDFGGGNLVSAGSGDIFVVKYDASGAHQWSQRFGGTGSDYGWGVAVDGSGNIFVTGSFFGATNFGGGNLVSAGPIDIFVAKYDASGAHQWSRRFGSTGFDEGVGIAVDGLGNVVVMGFFQLSTNFGGGNLVSAGGTDIFVAKYDASGAHQWSQRFGDTGDDYASGIAVDGSGNVVVTGVFDGTVDFGGGQLVSAGSSDIFVAEFDASGAHQWSRRFGSTGFDKGLAVAVDGSGNAFVTGFFIGATNFGGDNVVSAGYADIFVAKYDASGAHQWSQRFGSTGFDEGLGIAVDGLGNVVVTGVFEGTVDFGGGNLVSAGSWDIFVARYDEEGPTPVLISRFDATPRQSGVELTWEFSSDETLDGFTVYRGQGQSLPVAIATGDARTTRSYTDASVEPGESYRYELLIRTASGDEFRSPVATATTPRAVTTLAQNVPNPFNPRTMIAFSIKDRGEVSLKIYNLAGQLVRTLANESLAAGPHSKVWDGRDDSGQPIASGVYFYKLVAGSFTDTKKMTILK